MLYESEYEQLLSSVVEMMLMLTLLFVSLCCVVTAKLITTFIIFKQYTLFVKK